MKQKCEEDAWKLGSGLYGKITRKSPPETPSCREKTKKEERSRIPSQAILLTYSKCSHVLVERSLFIVPFKIIFVQFRHLINAHNYSIEMCLPNSQLWRANMIHGLQNLHCVLDHSQKIMLYWQVHLFHWNTFYRLTTDCLKDFISVTANENI